MWNVPVLRGERTAPLQSSGDPVSAGMIDDLLRRLALEFPVPDAAFRNIADDQSRGGAIPGLTALETYADAAVENYRGAGSLDRVGPAVRWRSTTHPPTLAWHDRTLLVAPLERSGRRIVLEYVEERDDRETAIELAGRARMLTQQYVDWRLYTGRNSAVIDGETPLVPLGRRVWRALIRLPEGLSGVLLGKVVRRLGPMRNILDEDPSQQSRLKILEEQHPDVALQAPRLGSGHVVHDIVAVFVHGTHSCGVPSLKDLEGHLTVPTVRYEHDTFRPVVENAKELEMLVRDKVQCSKLLLLGHSRGGLVARQAAAYLRDPGGPEIETWTFGTPHHGTPLVGRGLELFGKHWLGKRRKLGMLLKLDTATDAHGVPIEDPVSATLSI